MDLPKMMNGEIKSFLGVRFLRVRARGFRGTVKYFLKTLKWEPLEILEDTDEPKTKPEVKE